MERQVKQITELMKVLANENRLLVLCELIKGPRTVSGLCEKIPGITQPALSQHLTLLKAHRILDCTKSGQSVTYFLADRRVEEVIAVLGKQYCNQETADKEE